MKSLRRAAMLSVCLCASGGLAVQAQDNTAYGSGALHSNTSGTANSAFGYETLYENTVGRYNTAAGFQALYSNIDGELNTAHGGLALYSNTTGDRNTAAGFQALYSNTSGQLNTAHGVMALYSNTTGQDNTAVGYSALGDNTTGLGNTASGHLALASNTTGDRNTASGDWALAQNTTGSDNTAVGSLALRSNTTGKFNIGLGYAAGYYATSGSRNIHIGNTGSASDNGVIRIGQLGHQSALFVAGAYGAPISGPLPLYINVDGQLGTIASSIRYKEDVRDMADASDALLRLRPVTYRYKQPYADGSKPVDYGLIAEEVAEVYPDLVVRDADGQVQTVQYQKLTPLLLNEVQKQRQLLEQQERRLAALEAALASSRP